MTTGSKTSTSYRVVGSRPVRPDAADKATGAAIFGVDTKVPGLVPGVVLRSPHAHARIKSIDTSQAEGVPGVLGVVTAKDAWPANEWGKPIDCKVKYFRDYYIASDLVMHYGQAVAVVAATDRFIAEEAAKRILVDYEVLPPIMDLRQAMAPETPKLLDPVEVDTLGRGGVEPKNVVTHHQYVKGDPAAGMAEAEVVIEREFRTSTTHQGYLEPHVAVAAWAPEGMLTVWCSTQGHFPARTAIAQFFGCPVSKVRVIPMEVGGAFGGKIPTHLEPLAALIARKAGRPVRLVMSRAETFDQTGPSPATYMKIKIGAKRSGKITSMIAEIWFDAGAYPEPGNIGTALTCTFAPYDTPNGQLDGYEVLVNKPRHAAYRAPGATQTMFAAETTVNELAEQLGLDPLEFRLMNVARAGTEQITGAILAPVAYEQTLRRATEHPHYRAPLSGPNRGRGVACGWWPNFGLPSCATLQIYTDGSINLAEGSVDLQGTRTSLAMQAAEVLGVDVSRIHPHVADTDSVGWTAVTGGSRTTFATGWAVIDAARKALAEMCNRAAKVWGVAADTVSAEAGVFTTTADAAKRLTFDEVAASLMSTGGPIFTSGTADPTQFGAAIGVQIADVEVDPETGLVKVLRYTAFQDVGKAIHPGLVEGQIQGGVTQGIGWALWEGYKYDEKGKMANRSFLDYKLPTALDVPMIDVVLVEDVPNPGHPFGVRGVGETPIVPPPAVLANAIYRAVGARMRTLPMTPDRILQEMGVIE
jgi:xanthine dehydrogenase molybdenum-binding subunit